MEHYDDIEICSDCLLYHESGDMSYLELSDDQEEVLQRVEAGAKDLVKRGLVLVSKSSEEHEPFFSWTRCDVCDSKLGGDRHEATLLRKENHVHA